MSKVSRKLFITLALLCIFPLVVLFGLHFVSAKLLGQQAAQLLSERLGADVLIEELSLDLLTVTPGIKITNASVRQDADVLVNISSLHAEVDLRDSLFDRLTLNTLHVTGGSVLVKRLADGSINLQDLTPSSGQDDKGGEEPNEWPVIEHIKVENYDVLLDDEITDSVAELMIAIESSNNQSPSPTTMSVSGSANDVPVSFALQTVSLPDLLDRTKALNIDARAEVGDTDVLIAGTINNARTFTDLDLSLSVDMPSTDDLARVTGLKIPVLLPLKLSSAVERDDSQWILRRFDGTFGDTDIEGDIRLDITTTPATLYANVISNTLDLDDFATLIGGEPDSDETTVRDERDYLADDDTNRLLPSMELNLSSITELMQGAIEYRAEKVSTELWPIDSIVMTAELSAERLLISPMVVGIADGEIESSVSIVTESQTPQVTVEYRAKALSLNSLLASLNVDEDSFGKLGGRGKFWMQGDSVSSLVASADGGQFLLMTGGKVDALLVELAGIDLVESLALLLDPDKVKSTINCAYIDIHSKKGVFNVNTMVIDTVDTVFLADGSVDMNNEILDLILEPHPKDPSLLSAQSAVHIEGTLTEPKVAPGSALAQRAAIAATLAALASPVAALLPFIQPGSGEDSAYCDGWVEKLDKAR